MFRSKYEKTCFIVVIMNIFFFPDKIYLIQNIQFIGKIYEYMGMTIDYSLPGKVQISMVNYIENMLSKLPGDMVGTATSPAASHLFSVKDNPDMLKGYGG